MPIRSWYPSPRIRRGIAASVLVLSAGGLILYRAPADARAPAPVARDAPSLPTGPNVVSFGGPGAHGTLGLSHTKVLAGGERRIFAELRLTADAAEHAKERAPLSLVVVLDTSGSMGGAKIEQAKDSVVKLLRDMRDDDEIAMVRYESSSELVQPLARVGEVRRGLIEKVLAIQASGGTNIPDGLSRGLGALAEAGKGRVRRVVLVSDGLDSTRAQAERMAHDSADRGVTISSLGIGLDFDESYMSGVAHAGHGNFGFVKDAGALASFLGRELEETATTTVEDAAARIHLPDGVRFVRATGADARASGGDVELRLGSLFASDERRVVVELAARLDAGEVRGVDANATWKTVGGADATDVKTARLDLAGTSSAAEVEESRDGTILASATSALASIRQIEATEAYNRGDGARAQALIDENVAELHAAATAAPSAAPALEQQWRSYGEAKAEFAAAPPMSPAGKAAAKVQVQKNFSNLGRSAAF